MALNTLLKDILFGMLRVHRTPPTVTSAIVGLLLSGVFDLDKILLLGLAIFFFHTSAGAVNDIADYEVDKINAPERLLVKGTLTKGQAILLAASLILIALLSTWILDRLLFFIAVSFGFIFEVIYNFGLKIKNTPVGSYLYLASAASTVPFLTGCIVARNININTIIFSLFLMVLSSGVLMSSLKDVEGDRLSGKRTVAVVLGQDTARKLTSILLVLPLPLYVIPPYVFHFSYVYLPLCVIPSGIRAFSASSIYKDPSQKNAKRLAVIFRLLIAIDLLILALARPQYGLSAL